MKNPVIVILSEAAASLREAAEQSKGPYRRLETAGLGVVLRKTPKDRVWWRGRGSSTPPVHSQANEPAPLRMTTQGQPAVRSRSARRFLQGLKSCVLVFAAALREIFDESAYARFLNQRRLVSSRTAYAAFRLEHEAAKARRPRCC